ncbi:hypothetical protein BK749_12805 [Bacillus thuringiensis serovar vazensis]|uniref:Uncharacterized protein n=1 Tax=Bacillus thuringiensis serovar vazensis TaxID=180867 RepID=A0A243CX74_BACTU|nr:hypothetical protein BK749_12805 [Bacillus thuringiensis serovar vazensis]
MFFGTQLGKGVAYFSGKWVRDLGKNFHGIYSLIFIKHFKQVDMTAFLTGFVKNIGTRLGKGVASF